MFPLTVSLLDRFLSASLTLSVSPFCLAAACVLLASKLTESDTVTADALCASVEYDFMPYHLRVSGCRDDPHCRSHLSLSHSLSHSLSLLLLHAHTHTHTHGVESKNYIFAHMLVLTSQQSQAKEITGLCICHLELIHIELDCV